MLGKDQPYALLDFCSNLGGHEVPMWVDMVLLEFLVDVCAVVLSECLN